MLKNCNVKYNFHCFIVGIVLFIIAFFAAFILFCIFGEQVSYHFTKAFLIEDEKEKHYLNSCANFILLVYLCNVWGICTAKSLVLKVRLAQCVYRSTLLRINFTLVKVL